MHALVIAYLLHGRGELGRAEVEEGVHVCDLRFSTHHPHDQLILCPLLLKLHQ